MRLEALRLAAIVGVVALWLPTASGAFTVDTFSTPSPPSVFTVGTTPAATHSGTGILGTRTLSSSAALTAGSTVSIGGGTFQVFTSTLALESTLTYSGAGFPLNLTGQGLQLDFTFLDGGTPTTTVFAVTLNTSTGALTGSITLADSLVPFSALLSFASLTGPGTLGSVNSLSIGFNDTGSPQAGADFILDALSIEPAGSVSVPEPSSMMVLGAAVLGVLWQVRRRGRRGK